MCGPFRGRADARHGFLRSPGCALSIVTVKCAFFLAVPPASAQAHDLEPDAPLQFEVASVKPCNAGKAVAIRALPGGRWIASNASLRLLITWAYNITDERLIGAAGWVDSARFDITAQAPIENPTLDQEHSMVESLLANRFLL
jgi:hypothetical protein